MSVLLREYVFRPYLILPNRTPFELILRGLSQQTERRKMKRYVNR